MKRVLIILALSLFAVGAFAQKGKVYIGTSIMTPVQASTEDAPVSFQTGFSYNKTGDVKTTRFGLAPEVGYFLSDKFAIGLGVAFNYGSVKVGDGNAENVTYWGVNPYARYYACSVDKFSFYMQGGFHYSSGKIKDMDALNQWGVNIMPGVAYNLSDKFAINATFGKVGYNHLAKESNEFGIDLSMSSLNFGLTYSF